jgi:multicomponent Na+:H+ antiporter subunit E
MKCKKTAGNKGRSAEDYLDKSKHFNGFDAKPADLLKGFIFRWIIFALIWWGLSMGKISQPFLIMFVITISAALSSLLIPPQNIRITGIIRFTPFFIRLSVLGGLDVASRAFRPSMPLNTGFMNYNLKLANSTARVIFVWVVSLLPGTASVQLVGENLRIHVLDQELSHKQRLRELEKHVAALFRN